MANGAIVAWDTCILIDAIQKTPGKWETIAPMLNTAQMGDLKIVISTISVAETYWLRHLSAQGMNQAEQNALLDGWLEHDFLVKRAADFGTCKIAAEIGRITKGALRPNDAIIAATAIRHGASALITYDDSAGESLLKQDGKLSIAGARALKICEPQHWPHRGQAGLPLGIPGP